MPPGGDGGHGFASQRAIHFYGGGREAVLGGAVVAQLAAAVVAPGEQAAVRCQGQALVLPCRNCHDGPSRQFLAGDDFHRTVAVADGKTVAQLPRVAVSPSHHLAVRRQRQAVLVAGADRHDFFACEGAAGIHRRWREKLIDVLSRAELAVVPNAPGVNPAFVGQG